jgi:hypothetical protein
MPIKAIILFPSNGFLKSIRKTFTTINDVAIKSKILVKIFMFCILRIKILKFDGMPNTFNIRG